MADAYENATGAKDLPGKEDVCGEKEKENRKLRYDYARALLDTKLINLKNERGSYIEGGTKIGDFAIKDNTKFTHFNRYRFADEVDYMTSGIGYIFMTRPHLNIIDNEDIQDNFLLAISKGTSQQSQMIKQNLCANYNTTGGSAIDSKFMPIITSSAESFETKDNILKIRETGENFVGNKIVYGDVQTESLNADTFNIEYTEYSDGSLLLLHKTWVDYIHAVKINKIRPKRYNNVKEVTLVSSIFKGADDREYGEDYVMSRTIDYASSLYYFLLDPDGTTIRYWCKYTGVFPTSVPYSAMSFKLGENSLKKLNIVYQYSFKTDMDPYTLEEFAYLTSFSIADTCKLRESKPNSSFKESEHNNLELNHDPIRNNTWRRHVTINEERTKLIFTNTL